MNAPKTSPLPHGKHNTSLYQPHTAPLWRRLVQRRCYSLCRFKQRYRKRRSRVPDTFFSSWGTDASGSNYAQSVGITMNAPKTATATWQTQYYFTVNSSYGNITSGNSWVVAGNSVYAGLDSGISGNYYFHSWSGDATGTDYNKSNVIVMNSAKTATAVWQLLLKLSKNITLLSKSKTIVTKLFAFKVSKIMLKVYASLINLTNVRYRINKTYALLGRIKARIAKNNNIRFLIKQNMSKK